MKQEKKSLQKKSAEKSPDDDADDEGAQQWSRVIRLSHTNTSDFVSSVQFSSIEVENGQ